MQNQKKRQPDRGKNYKNGETQKEPKKKDERTAFDKVQEILDEKMADSKDGMVYLDDTDFRTLMESAKGGRDYADGRGQAEAGTVVDLQL